MNNDIKVQAALEAAVTYNPAIHEVRSRESQMNRHIAAQRQLLADIDRAAKRRAQTGEPCPVG